MPRVTRFVDPSASLPPNYEMTIVAQDPAVEHNGRILTARVRVPADRLLPGPRSHRFHVVDFDAASGALRPPAELLSGKGPSGWDYEDRFGSASDDVLRNDPAFHAQNIYAIAARTLAAFEAALGRRIAWGFRSSQLFLVPHAFAEPNAYYAAEDRALYFGYLPSQSRDARGSVCTCLSHDVVAHETTHAVLDGLRPRFVEPGLPDQAAFHEALADVVALLSVFSAPEVVSVLLGEPDRDGRILESTVSEANLQENALFGLAEQLGASLSGARADALRRSVRLEPGTNWLNDAAYNEPHRRGEVFVAAVTRTLMRIWRSRLAALIHGGGLDRNRAAEEGAKSAAHLLGMCCRAIDYCPPVEFEFGDFVEAVLVSDAEMAPDDRRGYRTALTESFASYGIHPPANGMVDLSDSGALLYHGINVNALRADADEVHRFLWQNADMLDIAPSPFLRVESVRPAVRVGPDGLVMGDVIAEYTQVLEGTARDLAPSGLKVPAEVAPDTALQCWGGGVIVFDQFAKAKFHQSKPILDWERQSRRLEYLVTTGLSDRSGRFGFSLGESRGQHFADLHATAVAAEERW